MDSQQKGEIGEKNLLEMLQKLLNSFSEISSLKRYESGFQGGKDIRAEAFFNYKKNELGVLGDDKSVWFFEAKNYKSKLDPNKLCGKLTQVKNSNNKIEVFCLFSPHEDLAGTSEELFTSEKLFDLPEYPFKIILWTPSYQIKEKLKCFPKIYKKVYGEKSNLKGKAREKKLNDWIKEIKTQTIEGKKIQKEFISKFRGVNQVWIPDSIEDAKDSILSSGFPEKANTKNDNILKKKLNCGGVISVGEIDSAKRNRIFSEGVRRKYKHKDDLFYNRLNELRQEIYNFCIKLEKEVLDKEELNEAIKFLERFEIDVKGFKENYRDIDLIKKLPDFYFKGQMFDITGACLLSLSKKWLEKVKKINGPDKF